MPFFQYNPFTGRLKPSTNFQPLNPISPIPLQKSELPVMIYDSIKTKPVSVTSKANYCTGKPSTLDAKMWQKYKFFQIDLDKPVFLAAGKRDKMLFGFTVICVALSTINSLIFVYKQTILK